MSTLTCPKCGSITVVAKGDFARLKDGWVCGSCRKQGLVGKITKAEIEPEAKVFNAPAAEVRKYKKKWDRA
ncbi:MAG: hypothetical protein PHX83_12130 [Acidobacteriia bacterium]|nr:hypothetical protein [Terriglobia bacterium]